MNTPKVNVMHEFTDKGVATLKFGRKVTFSGKIGYDNDTISQKNITIDTLSGLAAENAVRLSGKVGYGNNTQFSNNVSSIEEYNKMIKQPTGKRMQHSDYFTSWLNMNEYFTSEGILTFGSDGTKKFLEAFDCANVMGSTVISFSEHMGEEIKAAKVSEEEMYETIKPLIQNYFRQNNLLPENMLYNFSFHSDQDNLHIHLDFVEKQQTRTDMYMVENSFFNLKKNILFEYDMETKEIHKKILTKVEEVRQQTRENIKQEKFDVSSNQYKKAFAIMKEEELPRYYGDITSLELKSVISRIARKHNEQSNNYKFALHVFENYQKGLYGNSKKAAYFENKVDEMDKFAKNEIYRQIKTEYFAQFTTHFIPIKYEVKPEETKVKKLHINTAKRKNRRQREFAQIEREIYEGLEYL